MLEFTSGRRNSDSDGMPGCCGSAVVGNGPNTTDFGASKYDFAIFCHIAHQETPADNVAVFKKFRRALKPGGTLVVNDFVLNDDRTGHPFAMMFAAQMILVSKGGFAWRQAAAAQ